MTLIRLAIVGASLIAAAQLPAQARADVEGLIKVDRLPIPFTQDETLIVILRDTPALRAKLDSMCKGFASIRSALHELMRRYMLVSESTRALRQRALNSTLLADIRAADSSGAVELSLERNLIAAGDELTDFFASGMAAIEGQAIVKTTVPGLNYRFEGLEPGPRIVFGQTRLLDTARQWFRAVTLSAGKNSVDLDDSVSAQGPFCIRQ